MSWATCKLAEVALTRECSSIELKDDTIIIVLGASGDLAKKKTVCPTAAVLAQGSS